MTFRALILMLLATSPAFAQSTMSAEAFDSYTRGRTLYYAFDGQTYGVERYLNERRVIWSFLDGKCKNGIWYEEAGQICFVYEDRLEAQCWTFTETPGGLSARFDDGVEETELYQAQTEESEMLCYGPEVGV